MQRSDNSLQRDAEVPSAVEKVCLTCGVTGANISTFTRLGNSRANPEPLMNFLCCILKKSAIDVQLYSDVVCVKCFKKFESIEKLEYKLSETCKDIIQNFNQAVKIFANSDIDAKCEENQCLLVLNDVGLKANERGIIARAVALVGRKKREKDLDAKAERKHQCSFCNQTFRAYSHKVEHMVTHTQEKSFKCDVCGFLTTTKSNLSRHKQQHTDDYTCNICSRKLCSKFSLKEHMVIHGPSRSYQCDHCEKKFLRHRDKKIHEKGHLIESDSYKCDVCEKNFVLKSRLSRHMLIHCKEKKFVCSVCEKKFTRKDDLKCHERIHTGDKPYQCKECGKHFRFMSNCRNHMKSHSRETKVYRCNCCNISFLLEAKYKSHLRTRNHKRKSSEVTSDKHVYCNRCKTSFTTDDYAVHSSVCERKVKDYLQNEHFYCNVCGLSFENLDLLMEHSVQSHEMPAQTNETRVLLSAVGNNADIVGLTPLEQFTVNGESLDMVVSVGNDDTSLQIQHIQNTSSPALHPLSLESKSNVSENEINSNELHEISGTGNIVNGKAVVEPSVNASTSATNMGSIENNENLYKIGVWNMNPYCQK